MNDAALVGILQCRPNLAHDFEGAPYIDTLGVGRVEYVREGAPFQPLEDEKVQLVVPIEVQEHLLSENDRIAGHNREHFAGAGVTAINLMGSPGCGKTALLELLCKALRERYGSHEIGSADVIVALGGDGIMLDDVAFYGF